MNEDNVVLSMRWSGHHDGQGQRVLVNQPL